MFIKLCSKLTETIPRQTKTEKKLGRVEERGKD